MVIKYQIKTFFLAAAAQVSFLRERPDTETIGAGVITSQMLIQKYHHVLSRRV